MLRGPREKQKSNWPLQVVLDVELDQALCSTQCLQQASARDWTQALASLAAGLSKSYPPLTNDIILRSTPQAGVNHAGIGMPGAQRQTARAGSFEVSQVGRAMIQWICPFA